MPLFLGVFTLRGSVVVVRLAASTARDSGRGSAQEPMRLNAGKWCVAEAGQAIAGISAGHCGLRRPPHHCEARGVGYARCHQRSSCPTGKETRVLGPPTVDPAVALTSEAPEEVTLKSCTCPIAQKPLQNKARSQIHQRNTPTNSPEEANKNEIRRTNPGE